MSDDGAPREVWAYLVDGGGERLTEEQHVVLLPGGGADEVEAAIDRTFESLPGMEERQPAGIAFRFADGHVVTGELPEGSWDQVQWEEDEEGLP